MADFYDEMRTMAAELLAPTAQNGLGQVGIQLQRRTGAPPVNSWEMPTYSVTSYDLKAAAKGVSEELVGVAGSDGTIIVASDLEVVMSPPPGGIQAGDTISVNGEAATILLLRPIPAAGTVVVYRTVLRT